MKVNRVKKNRQTDRQTEGQTDKKQTIKQTKNLKVSGHPEYFRIYNAW